VPIAPDDPRYPHPASAAVTTLMRANRRSGTKPEHLLRSELHRRGARFRKDYLIRAGEVRIKADIVFPRQRVAVFVDGCFWHGCPDHGHLPRSNTHYWTPKLARNAARDKRTTAALERDGWRVVRLWEHVPVADAAAAVLAVLGRPPGVSALGRGHARVHDR
jgi:DNA mismatch endonuclease (patch repair protein)